MSLSLRPYQLDLHAQTKQALQAGHRSICVQLATGGGKTVLFAHMIKNCVSRGFTAWVLTHRKELVLQTVNTLTTAADLSVGIVAAGFSPTYSERVQVCMVASLPGRMKFLRKPDLIVIDECFAAGTMVDGRRIEELIVGDEVWSHSHTTGPEKKKVVRVFKSKPQTLCTVHLTDGRKFVCTYGHPFYVVGRYYQPAINLNSGDELVSMPSMRNTNRSEIEIRAGAHPKRLRGLLYARLLEKICRGALVFDDGSDKQKVCLGANEAAESNAVSGKPREDVAVLEGDWTPPISSWRQWHGIDYAAENSAGGITVVLHRDNTGTLHRYEGPEGKRHLDSLQNRFSGAGIRASDRVGRPDSLWRESPPQRLEEGILLERAWVDHVEVHKQGSFAESGELLPDGFVYNIEVEGNHNYFADGVLVHNCHHVVSKSWRAAIDPFPDAVKVSVSGTPERLDGAGLGEVCTHLIQGPSVADLISQGWLSPYKLYAPSNPDLSGVHTVAGDYNRKELSRAMNSSAVVGDALIHYQRHCMGKRAIVFAWSVEASERIAAEFQSAGIPAAHLDGATDDRERDAIVRGFRDGSIRVLSNVDILGEGFDVPAAEVAFLLRPTKSLAVYLQQVGRVMRPGPGKIAAIFDHAGNCRRHGMPDDDRVWSLDGRPKRKTDRETPVKQCPRCYGFNSASSMTCRDCGFEWEVVGREVARVEGDLAEVDVETQRRVQKMEQAAARDYDSLVALGRNRGYPKAELWARHVMRGRGSSYWASRNAGKKAAAVAGAVVEQGELL